jgi:hypothetical protein
LQTFTSDEYGYQMSLPKPWTIEDGEGGDSIELSAPNGLAFVKVGVTQRENSLSLTDHLLGRAWYESHEQSRTTREGRPTLRFNRSYILTSSGPTVRVEGLITASKTHVFTAQCGIITHPFDDPHVSETPVPDGVPEAVDWTPAIEQATTRVVESFTLGSEK